MCAITNLPPPFSASLLNVVRRTSGVLAAEGEISGTAQLIDQHGKSIGATGGAPTLLLVAETDLATVLGHIEQQKPDLLVIDSVQTIASAHRREQFGCQCWKPPAMMSAWQWTSPRHRRRSMGRHLHRW